MEVLQLQLKLIDMGFVTEAQELELYKIDLSCEGNEFYSSDEKTVDKQKALDGYKELIRLGKGNTLELHFPPSSVYLIIFWYFRIEQICLQYKEYGSVAGIDCEHNGEDDDGQKMYALQGTDENGQVFVSQIGHARYQSRNGTFLVSVFLLPIFFGSS